MTGLFPNPYMVTIAKLEKQNAELLEALKEIAKGEGPYSQDQQTHAENTIRHLTLIASQALAKAEGGK